MITFLLGHPDCSWRPWLRENTHGRAVLCLDPSEPILGPPGRLVLSVGEKPVWSRFYGSLTAQRSPHLFLVAAYEAIRLFPNDLIVQCFGYRRSPLMRHILTELVSITRPDEIVIAENTDVEIVGERVECEATLPSVRAATRKAHWMKLLGESQEHEVDLRRVSVQGGRLGSGVPVQVDFAAYAERCGSGLFVVAEEEPKDSDLTLALDANLCSRATIAAPNQFENLYVSFARANGEDFGLGFIQRIDWSARVATVMGNAVLPAPVKILRLGSLRVAPEGIELGELRPWQV